MTDIALEAAVEFARIEREALRLAELKIASQQLGELFHDEMESGLRRDKARLGKVIRHAA
jgi:hypothetical protein